MSMSNQNNKRRVRSSARPLRMESLEGRRLLAVDMLANLDLDDSTIFTPRDLVEYQGQIVFRGNDGNVGPEAWITSGDPADLRLIKDIRPGIFGSGPRDFTQFNGQLFFAANNGSSGYELWVTQGSNASTKLIGDIWAGTESGVPTDITVFKNEMYFFANDGESGRELYRSNGTPGGTVLVANAVEGSRGASGEQLTIVGDQMFFAGRSGDLEETGVWVSDGTEAGTRRIDIPGLDRDGVDKLMPFGDRLLFTTNDKLWVTDGTTEGSREVVDLDGSIEDVVVNRGRVFVTTASSDQLTVIASDLATTKTIPNAEGVAASEGRVYHWSSTGFYVLEPNDMSTRLIAFNSFFGTEMGDTFNVENGMLFHINRTLDRHEIWSTNGTLEGTKMVEMVRDESAEPLAGFQQIADSIYFTATNGNFRESLWKVAAPTIEAAVIPDPPSVEGDVTGDSLVNVQDIDAVFAAAASNSTDTSFDVNADGTVAASDGAHIVEAILQTRLGDLDLNGKVEFADFLVLSNNFGKEVSSYADGDADGDGKVAFADFLLMSDSFGFTA